MAQFEHLPIYKKAYDLALYFEKIVNIRTGVFRESNNNYGKQSKYIESQLERF